MKTPALVREQRVLPPSQWTNHRATVRYQCAPAASGRVSLPGDHEVQRAWLQDLSQGGIGMLLRRPLPEGAEIVISVKAAEQAFQLPARVVRSNQLANGDYLIGCEFVHSLTNEDLDQLL